MSAQYPDSKCCGVLVAGESGPDDPWGLTADNLDILGTAFLIAPFLALTARHVIDEIFLRYQGCLPPAATGDLKFGVDLGIYHPEHGLIRFSVGGYGYSPTIDVCALVLTPNRLLPRNFEWEMPTLRVLPPSKTDLIRCYGFPASTYKVDDLEGGKVTFQARESSGIVLDVHCLKRDDYWLTFPCIATSLDVRGGMSGGPAFDDDGKIVGVCSTSFVQAEEVDPLSYVALIWPAFALDLKEDLQGHAKPLPTYTIFSLIADGSLRVEDSRFLQCNAGSVTLRAPVVDRQAT